MRVPASVMTTIFLSFLYDFLSKKLCIARTSLMLIEGSGSRIKRSGFKVRGSLTRFLRIVNLFSGLGSRMRIE